MKNPQGKAERVKPADIKTTALMSVEGELDDISGSGQTQAVHDICTGVPKSQQKHFEAKGAGHYGIFSGRRWRDHVYPQVKAFILAHHTAVKAAPAKAPAQALTKAPVKKAVAAKSVPKAPAALVKPARTATKTVATKRKPATK